MFFAFYSDDSSSEDTSTDEERSNKKSNKPQKGHNSSKGVVPTQPGLIPPDTPIEDVDMAEGFSLNRLLDKVFTHF